MTQNDSDNLYMNRCFALASKATKEVKGNPKVGAVLVYGDRIIGEGFHQESGGPHAEVNCINSVSEEDIPLIQKSTLYVSLEPCCHYGKTPPCTGLIKKEKIKDLRISTLDPSDKISGSGVRELKDYGIQVKTGILEDKGKSLIRPFAVRQKHNRPYIILKIVKSKDNYIGQKGKKIWLTNPYTDVLTHKWRSEIDGILVGTNTVINDQPSLTTRNYPGDNPKRLIVDRHHRIPPDNPLLPENFFYFTYEIRGMIDHSHQRVIDKGRELESILHYLNEEDIYSIMIEGGSEIIRSFYKAGLWDEARIINSSLIMEEGIKAINIEGKLENEFHIDNNQIQVIIRNDS